jgi:uncharacterized membrane protein YkvA (DUF1232 family)
MASRALERVRGTLSDESREVFVGLLAEPMADPDELGRDIANYLERIRKEERENEFIDVGLAEKVARACRELLTRWDSFSSEERKLAQAAANYFVLQQDGDDDLECVLGFEDDAQVVNAVMDALGLSENRIDLHQNEQNTDAFGRSGRGSRE